MEDATKVNHHAQIDFSPTTFELPENLEAEEREDNMEGDMLVNKTNDVEKKEIPKATKEKLIGLKINKPNSAISSGFAVTYCVGLLSRTMHLKLFIFI